MLVLTRRVKQSIMIGDEIEITVVAIDGDQVKIGIDAPKHIDIHRKEIYIAIQDANKAATIGDLTAIEQLNTFLKK